MNRTFLDTSFFISLGELVTTEFVLIEIADDLSLPHLRTIAAAEIMKEDVTID